MGNQFRAIRVGTAISISEVDEQGVVVRHVATIPETAVPQFLDDVQKITDEWQWQAHTGDGAKRTGAD